ncbi:MAG TPA: hypothetical protein VEG38_14330 [Acidimicrobiia bacterium]|nr:hypothetical protein [Acidimicrobiia bacterium]
METPPVEITVRLYGLTSGESEVELSLPETSEVGRLLAGATPAERPHVFGRLRRHLVAELTDAFAQLERPPERVAGGTAATRLGTTSRGN